MAIDKAVDSAVLDAGLTAIADAIREKAGTEEVLAFPDGLVEAIGAIGGVEVNSFTIVDTSSNFIVETLESVPRCLMWYDSKWGLSIDSEIDQYKPLFGVMLKDVSENETLMRAIAAYKSSSTKATSYASAIQGNKTTATFNSAYNTSFATDAIRIIKESGSSELYSIVAHTLGNYGFRLGQTIEYIVLT